MSFSLFEFRCFNPSHRCVWWSGLFLRFLIFLYKHCKAFWLLIQWLMKIFLSAFGYLRVISSSSPAMGSLAWGQFSGESLTYHLHPPSLIPPSLPTPYLVPHSASLGLIGFCSNRPNYGPLKMNSNLWTPIRVLHACECVGSCVDYLGLH